jgi:hypothetical protein
LASLFLAFFASFLALFPSFFFFFFAVLSENDDFEEEEEEDLLESEGGRGEETGWGGWSKD